MGRWIGSGTSGGMDGRRPKPPHLLRLAAIYIALLTIKQAEEKIGCVWMPVRHCPREERASVEERVRLKKEHSSEERASISGRNARTRMFGLHLFNVYIYVPS